MQSPYPDELLHYTVTEALDAHADCVAQLEFGSVFTVALLASDIAPQTVFDITFSMVRVLCMYHKLMITLEACGIHNAD